MSVFIILHNVRNIQLQMSEFVFIKFLSIYYLFDLARLTKKLIRRRNYVIYLKDMEDIKKLEVNKNISSELKKLVTSDFEDIISEIEELGYTFSSEKYGASLLIENGEIIEFINHLNTNVIKETVPDFVCEFNSKIIKASVCLRPNYFLQIYFYRDDQPYLFEWCLKNQGFNNVFY
jgi:hypothetical protein